MKLRPLLYPLLALVVWAIIAKAVIPFAIAKGTEGMTWPPKKQRDETPTQYYHGKWDEVANVSLLGIAALAFAVFLRSNPQLLKRENYLPPATPGALGAIRALAAGTLLLSAVWEDLPSTVFLPVELRKEMGLLDWLYFVPGFELFLSNYVALATFKWIAAVVLFLAMIGAWARITVPLGAFCYFLIAAILRHYAWFYHTGLIPLYVLIVLSFTRCGDGFSVDRLVRIWRGKEVPDRDTSLPIYTWARYAVWIVIALPYTMAGASKLRHGGFLWWNADNLREIVYTDTLNPMEFHWQLGVNLSSAPDALFALLGMAGVLGELLFGLVLISFWARMIFPILMAGMHVGILFLQNILFFDLIILQFAFYDWRKVRLAIGRWIAERRGRLQVLYDGNCPFCRRTVKLLRGFDLFDRLEMLNFRELDLNQYNAQRKLLLTVEELDRQMYVVSGDGDAAAGFYGYRNIAWVLPALWVTVPFLYLPGITSAGVRLYGWVARNRLKLISCDESCPIEPEIEKRADLVAEATMPAGVPVPIRALLIALIALWVIRLEYFPFTSMRMYSANTAVDGPAGLVEYYRLVEVLESGESRRAYPEHVIGALSDARYRRQLKRAFEADRSDAARRLFETYVRMRNSNAPPGEQVTRLEVQKWQWNFRDSPSDPHHGKLVDRVVIDADRLASRER